MIHRLDYANTLRCIGRALERKGIDVFELIVTGAGEFSVEYCDSDPTHGGVLANCAITPRRPDLAAKFPAFSKGLELPT